MNTKPEYTDNSKRPAKRKLIHESYIVPIQAVGLLTGFVILVAIAVTVVN